MTTDLTGVDRDALLAASAAAGHPVNERMLETVRSQGLVPRPERVGNRGRTPVWRYPSGTERQLVRLLQWREHTKDPGVLGVLLWIEGFPIAAETVRAAVNTWLHTAMELIDRELAAEAQRQGVDPGSGQVLSSLAATFAAKRGANALPRLVRVPAAERTDSVELLLRLFMLGQPVETTESQAESVEKVLGVSPGRRQRVDGAGPWLTGPASDLFGAADIISLPSLMATSRQMTDTELESARLLAAAMFRYLPLMARMMGMLFGAENFAGMAGLRRMDEEPEFVMMLVPMIVGMLRAGWQENLETVATALNPFASLASSMERILGMPDAEVKRNLQGQPAEVQRVAEQLIAAALAGDLDDAPRRR